jgi:hypothetical protein
MNDTDILSSEQPLVGGGEVVHRGRLGGRNGARVGQACVELRGRELDAVAQGPTVEQDPVRHHNDADGPGVGRQDVRGAVGHNADPGGPLARHRGIPARRRSTHPLPPAPCSLLPRACGSLSRRQHLGSRRPRPLVIQGHPGASAFRRVLVRVAPILHLGRAWLKSEERALRGDEDTTNRPVPWRWRLRSGTEPMPMAKSAVSHVLSALSLRNDALSLICHLGKTAQESGDLAMLAALRERA